MDLYGNPSCGGFDDGQGVKNRLLTLRISYALTGDRTAPAMNGIMIKCHTYKCARHALIQLNEGFMIWGHDPPRTHEKITSHCSD